MGKQVVYTTSAVTYTIDNRIDLLPNPVSPRRASQPVPSYLYSMVGMACGAGRGNVINEYIAILSSFVTTYRLPVPPMTEKITVPE